MHQGKRTRRRRKLKEGIKLSVSLARLETGPKTPAELAGLGLHFHGRQLTGDVWPAMKPVSLGIRGKLIYLSPTPEKNPKNLTVLLALLLEVDVLSRV